MENNIKLLSLQERASAFSQLVREVGWKLLEQTYRPEIRFRICDSDDREAFLYEAIRAQLIQEIFSTPYLIMKQAERERQRNASPVTDETAIND